MRQIQPILLVVIAIASASAQQPPAPADQPVYIVTYLESTPAARQQVATALTQYATASRTEGALYVEALQDTSAANHFALLEGWRDQRALDAHRAAAASGRFRTTVEPMLLAPIDERLCVSTFVAPARAGRPTTFVVTHVDVPGTNRDAALVALKSVAERSRTEGGNLRYDVVHQRDRTNHFTVIETWADRAVNDAHQLTAHVKEFRRQITPLLGALYDQRWYRPI